MHPRTEMTLAELRNANWFARVGSKDTGHAKVLSSWDEAIESCRSVEWENLCLEAANQYCERLAEASPAIFSRWNEVVEMVRPAAVDLVREKASAVVAQFNLPPVFIDTVNWDILHVCLEAELADVITPGYYASQAYWYVVGHFPCGWEGEFPSGKLVIY